MTIKKLTESSDILVKVDHNNLIYVDPNSVISNGVIQKREVDPENLVMYVNLEAELVPRTTLIATDNTNTLVSIAKGTLNMMHNNGKDFDTSWTEAFLNISENKLKKGEYTQYDNSGQSFGMKSIDIKILGANFVPNITIKFTDVRGKTLFESPENSPYNAFFHLPWPVFYLTIKGYYGKAIRYRLSMVKFNSSLNSDTGDFEIETVFVGSVYAYLSDIPFDGVLNAPYMFAIKASMGNGNYNEKTQQYEQVLKKTSKGYQTLKSVYQRYKQKGLIEPDFPVKTLREVIVMSKRLDKIMEQEIFDQVISPAVLSGVKDYDYLITDFVKAVSEWQKKYLTSEVVLDSNGNYAGLTLAGSEKNKTDIILGKDKANTLEHLINRYTTLLNSNEAFGINRNVNLIKKEGINIQPISFVNLQNINDFYTAKYESKIAVNMDLLFKRLAEAETDYVKKRDAIIKTITDRMNTIIEGKSKKDLGIGFKPTIRNVMAVVCANAETYIKLMKDTHNRAFDASEIRSKLLSGVSTDSIGSDNIYPWPEVKKHSVSEKQNVLVYPGSLDMYKKLRSNESSIWPEVEFVEEYYGVSTMKSDSLSEKEADVNTELIFEDDTESQYKKNLSTFTYLTDVIPYYDKSISSILYEIWERSKTITTFDSFTTKTTTELAKIEFENIQNQLKGDNDIIGILSKVTSMQGLLEYMRGFSPFERYPYYQDQLTTVDYISSAIDQDFKIEKYTKNTNTNDTTESYPALIENLNNYVSEDYRTKIYPFSSDTYLSYIKKPAFTKNELSLNKILTVNTNNGFIISPEDPKMWVKTDYKTDIFSNKIKVGKDLKHILNTPYFHKQLLTDFNNDKIVGKYSGSAYLLLTTLAFNDLDDIIITSDGTKSILMSSLFREVGATHYIPYHLMLKWGAIYHRYKKFIVEGIDIIENVTDAIDGDLYFDNYLGRTYTVGADNITRSEQTNIGLNPFYQTIFNQIVNDYSFFNQISPTGNIEYTNKVNSGEINIFGSSLNGGKAWSSFIDNSKHDNTDLRYTVLPSNGTVNYTDISDFNTAEQENYNILWNYSNDVSMPVYTEQTFPAPNEYIKNINNEYSISLNNKKVLDLIATFKPQILEVFETAFLNFSTVKMKTEVENSIYNVKHSNFQSMLKSLVSIKKDSNDSTLSIQDKINKIKTKQKQTAIDLTNEILETTNLIKLTLSNPKELNNNILGGFTNTDTLTFNSGEFNNGQLTPDNLEFIKLYLGEDIDLHYQNFFSVNNIRLNDENILKFRFLIYIYAGYVKAGNVNDKGSFSRYLIDNILNKNSDVNDNKVTGQYQRMRHFLTELTRNFSKLKSEDSGRLIDLKHGYNDDVIKLELYNYFKSFNDKWTAGKMIEDKPLLEEFLFLDKANKDIGDSVYISLKRLADISNQKNKNKLDFFTMINILIKDSGFDLRVLPAYVNFYGTNFSNKTKIKPSKTLAKNLFGSFLDVDNEESTSKIILHYMGPTSKYLKMSDIKSNLYKFKNDGFDISNEHNNPVIVAPDVFRNTDFSRSNKVVAFEVSFGDQNQTIFRGFEMNQNSLKNTSESFQVLENLGRSESGASVAQLDIGLFEIYKQVSYTVEVVCLGDVMIQPTMYFYLKNIPMFEGSYWITEVSHSIGVGKFETRFKGSRIPMLSLPDPEDSFMSSYRNLFDDLSNKATSMVKQKPSDSDISKTQIVFKQPNGTSGIAEIGEKGRLDCEEFVKIISITDYYVPFNGYMEEKYVQKIIYKDKGEWLRSVVVLMGGKDNPINDDTIMSNISAYSNKIVKWKDISNNTDKLDFYSARFNNPNVKVLIDDYDNTEFLNPENGTRISILHKDATNDNIIGPINTGPSVTGYGISMSQSLMKKLVLKSGDVVYYRLNK